MTTLVLYALARSPYCSKVRVTLRMKEIDFIELEPAGGSFETTLYQQIVAAGSVPAIRIDDWVLHDSQAIIDYLDEVYPQVKIWSSAPRLRAEQRALVHYHDSKLEPAVKTLAQLVGQRQSRQWLLRLDQAQDDLFDRFYRLDRMLAGFERDALWLGQHSPCVADWAFALTIQMGLDILQHLDREVTVALSVSRLIDRAGRHLIIADELALLRKAVGAWLLQGKVIN